MKDHLLDKLTYPLLLDGPMGTELFNKEQILNPKPAIIYNKTNPEWVLKIHQDYIQAGSQIIYTNTFCGDFYQLSKINLASEQKELFQTAISLAKQATQKNPTTLIAGCIGPLLDQKEFNFEKMKKLFFTQIELLENTDLIILETQYHLAQIKAALEAFREANLNRHIGLSVTLNKKSELLDGTSIEKLVQEIDLNQIDFFGFNCGFKIEAIYPAFVKIKNYFKKPILVKPNFHFSNSHKSKKEKEFFNWIEKFYQEGAKLLGVCCGGNKEHITTIKTILSGPH